MYGHDIIFINEMAIQEMFMMCSHCDLLLYYLHDDWIFFASEKIINTKK
jgi:hypothetical protein